MIFAYSAGAARLPQALRACSRRCALPLRVIEHTRAFGARPAMLAPSALAAGAARLRLGPPCSHLRRSQQTLRACGRHCAPAAGGERYPNTFAPLALAAGAARLRQRCACAAHLRQALRVRVIEHTRAFGARPAMLALSALAAGAARLRLSPPCSRLRRSQQALRACGKKIPFFISKKNA